MSRNVSRPRAATTALAEEIQGYVRARVPILYLVTWEEERVLREIVEPDNIGTRIAPGISVGPLGKQRNADLFSGTVR